MSEVGRIRAEYERRSRALPAGRYEPTNPAQVFLRQSRETAALRALRMSGMIPLANRRILDVGCGTGDGLIEFLLWGADPGSCAGIDLIPERIDKVRHRLGGADGATRGLCDLRCGDASQLPWTDATFDIVSQSMMFSSILDREMRTEVAGEIARVLCPEGVVLWYDFVLPNPSNPNIRPISLRELRRLFPGCTIRASRVTLAQPIARRLVKHWWLGALALERTRLLNSHILAAISRGRTAR